MDIGALEVNYYYYYYYYQAFKVGVVGNLVSTFDVGF